MDQIVDPIQTLSPDAEGIYRLAHIHMLAYSSLWPVPYLDIIKCWFSSRTELFSSLLLVSAKVVNMPLSRHDEFVAKHR